MFFKLDYTVRELTLPHEAEWQFDYAGPYDLRVILRAPSADEQKRGHSVTDAFCTAFASREVNAANAAVFRKIELNQVILGEEQHGGGSWEYTTPEGVRIKTPSLSKLPQSFQSFISNVSDELRDIAGRTVLSLRWRLNARGPHQPFSSLGLHWSTDGEFWHPAPLDLHVTVEMLGPVDAPPELRASVQDLVKSGSSEPLHHGFFREAWAQRKTNPRSALVTGMSAAELSVKYCISTLVPGAEWLATHLPTPPLVRILTDYLPKLQARCTFGGKTKAPPKTILDSLRKGVTLRNEVTHAGTATPSAQAVEEILCSVQDLLWLIDYYSGSDWAIAFLRNEVKAELVAE
jgi:hypothetical protein